MNSFYNDDLAQRIFILWIMAILVVYGNNAVLVDTDLGALRATVGAYILARSSSNMAHLIYSFASYHHRAQQRLWFCLSSLTLFIYVPLFLESLSWKTKIIIASTAVITEECLWIFCYSPVAKRLIGAKYTTAVDIPHEVDRYAAFFIIVLGEFLYSVIVGNPAAVGFSLGLMRAIWTLIIAFCLNWLYVHNDGSLQNEHPYRHNIYASFVWVTLHLPLVAALLAGGHVAAVSVKEGHMHGAELWLLCGGLGSGLLLLWPLALLHKCGDAPGVLIMPKVCIMCSFHLLFSDLFTASSPYPSSYHRRPHHLSTSDRIQRNHATHDHHDSHGCMCRVGKCDIFGSWSKVLGAMDEHGVSRKRWRRCTIAKMIDGKLLLWGLCQAHADIEDGA